MGAFTNFIINIGSNRSMPCGVCQAMGAITHFAWLSFFSWMCKCVPIEMCIKSAPYLHEKNANWSLNRLLFLC